MRVLIQRVTRACVRVAGGPTREIGRGLAILVGLGPKDQPELVRRLAEKVAHMRIFPNEAGKFDRSLMDVEGSALVVSQFTLYGDCSRGRRPDFTQALEPARAEPLYLEFVNALSQLGLRVATGEFGARMEVEIVNDGPVTVWLDSEKL